MGKVLKKNLQAHQSVSWHHLHQLLGLKTFSINWIFFFIEKFVSVVRNTVSG